MPFIGNQPSAVPLTSADITDGIITSAKIADGTIVNADINASAAIAGTKLSGAGKVLQVVQTNKGDITSSSSTSYADITGMSVNITPSSASNKILVLFSVNISTNNQDAQLKLLRDSTDIIGSGATNNATSFVRTANGDTLIPAVTMYLDSPSTTSAVTYKLQWKMGVAGTLYLNRRFGDASFGAISNITVMEIAA